MFPKTLTLIITIASAGIAVAHPDPSGDGNKSKSLHAPHNLKNGYDQSWLSSAEARTEIRELDRMLLDQIEALQPRTSKTVAAKFISPSRFTLGAPAAKISRIGEKMGMRDREASTYGRYTEVRSPVMPKARKVDAPVPVASRASPIDLWRMPVRLDFSRTLTVREGFDGVLSLVGYQFLDSGSAVDSEAVEALEAPMPRALSAREYVAPSAEHALVGLAGRGLVVVVDHGHKLVSVDFSARGARVAGLDGAAL